MKRILCFSTLFLATIIFAQAQDTTAKAEPVKNWTYKGLTGLNFAQAALVNWSAGGENTISGNIYFNGQLNYKKDRWIWENVLSTELGTMYSQTNDWQKTVDKLQLTSKLGYAQNKKLYYSVVADFLTQYAKGYSKPTDINYLSNFMAPGYLTVAAGIDFKPSSVFSFFFSPLTERLTFVLDDSLSLAGAFGVAPGDKIHAQSGMLAKLAMDLKVAENIQIISTLDLFTAYDDTFGNVVVDWNTLISMKITKYLTSTLNLGLKYDNAVKTTESVNGVDVERGAKVQFKEILGLGISYTF